jgi:hypothetical protein
VHEVKERRLALPAGWVDIRLTFSDTRGRDRPEKAARKKIPLEKEPPLPPAAALVGHIALATPS